MIKEKLINQILKVKNNIKKLNFYKLDILSENKDVFSKFYMQISNRIFFTFSFQKFEKPNQT